MGGETHEDVDGECEGGMSGSNRVGNEDAADDLHDDDDVVNY